MLFCRCVVEIPSYDKTIKQSPNKDCMKQSLEWTLEQSPVLGKRVKYVYYFTYFYYVRLLYNYRDLSKGCTYVCIKCCSQNQKPCLIKKKGEQNIFEDTDFNKLKRQNVNNELRHSQKEDICKRRLFQNDREQLETITAPSTTQ